MVLTTIKGKTNPIAKKLIQFTDPPIMNASVRVDCVNNSAVKVFVTPPMKLKKKKHSNQHKMKLHLFFHI